MTIDCSVGLLICLYGTCIRSSTRGYFSCLKPFSVSTIRLIANLAVCSVSYFSPYCFSIAVKRSFQKAQRSIAEPSLAFRSNSLGATEVFL